MLSRYRTTGADLPVHDNRKAFAEELAARLRQRGVAVRTSHRDVSR